MENKDSNWMDKAMDGIAKEQEYKRNVDSLLRLIADAHKRMATNRNKEYRKKQQEKIDKWLETLTKMYEEEGELWMLTQLE